MIDVTNAIKEFNNYKGSEKTVQDVFFQEMTLCI